MEIPAYNVLGGRARARGGRGARGRGTGRGRGFNKLLFLEPRIGRGRGTFRGRGRGNPPVYLVTNHNGVAQATETKQPKLVTSLVRKQPPLRPQPKQYELIDLIKLPKPSEPAMSELSGLPTLPQPQSGPFPPSLSTLYRKPWHLPAPVRLKPNGFVTPQLNGFSAPLSQPPVQPPSYAPFHNHKRVSYEEYGNAPDSLWEEFQRYAAMLSETDIQQMRSMDPVIALNEFFFNTLRHPLPQHWYVQTSSQPPQWMCGISMHSITGLKSELARAQRDNKKEAKRRASDMILTRILSDRGLPVQHHTQSRNALRPMGAQRPVPALQTTHRPAIHSTSQTISVPGTSVRQVPALFDKVEALVRQGNGTISIKIEVTSNEKKTAEAKSVNHDDPNDDASDTSTKRVATPVQPDKEPTTLSVMNPGPKREVKAQQMQKPTTESLLNLSPASSERRETGIQLLTPGDAVGQGTQQAHIRHVPTRGRWYRGRGRGVYGRGAYGRGRGWRLGRHWRDGQGTMRYSWDN